MPRILRQEDPAQQIVSETGLCEAESDNYGRDGEDSKEEIGDQEPPCFCKEKAHGSAVLSPLHLVSPQCAGKGEKQRHVEAVNIAREDGQGTASSQRGNGAVRGIHHRRMSKKHKDGQEHPQDGIDCAFIFCHKTFPSLSSGNAI